MSANMNTTTNGTQPLTCINPTTEKIGSTVAYCLIFVVSMVGNIFIGIIVYKTKTMRQPINFLIVNMAMSDLLYPIFQFLRVLTRLHVSSWLLRGPPGQTVCKLVAFLPEVSCAVSIQSLVLIAVDRFGAVVFPLCPPLISSKLCPFFILATWIVAIAMLSPNFFVHSCLSPYSPSFDNYYLTKYVIFLDIPLVVIAILYTIIYSKLKSQTIPGEQSVNATQQREKRERNVLKMAIAIVSGFAVCWLPFSIAWILSHFVSDIWSCSFEYFWSVANILAHANCAMNPCICFIFSGKYRQALKNLLKCF